MTSRELTQFICTASLATFVAGLTHAADIKVLSPIAMRGAVPDIAGQFEKASGHKTSIEYATVGEITKRVLKGEAADVIIVSVQSMEDLQKQGRVVSGSQSDIARVGVGVFVRAGAPKPDIGSTDAFKRTLLTAKSISYGDPASGGVSGVHMGRLVEKLGIAGEVKSKTRLFPNSQAGLDAVAKGDSEIGIGLTSDTALVSGVDLVGALPKDIQNFTNYSAGVLSNSKHADAAKAFIKSFATPAAQTALKSKGFDPR